MTIDATVAQYHENREREYHQILVRAGLRPASSRLEDFRPRHDEAIVPATVKAAGRQSEAAEL